MSVRLNWMRWTPHTHHHMHRRRRQRFSLRMFSIFLCCFRCLCLCLSFYVYDIDCVIMLTVRFAFSRWNFHNKSEQNKSDNSVYGVCSAFRKKDCVVFASYYTTYLVYVQTTKTADVTTYFVFSRYILMYVHVCDAMRCDTFYDFAQWQNRWFGRLSTSYSIHTHTFPIQMINMLSIFYLNKMRRNQRELYTHSRHPNRTCKFVVCTQQKCVSMCICFSLCVLFV